MEPTSGLNLDDGNLGFGKAEDDFSGVDDFNQMIKTILHKISTVSLID